LIVGKLVPIIVIGTFIMGDEDEIDRLLIKGVKVEL
jgi:hypothetical protein